MVKENILDILINIADELNSKLTDNNEYTGVNFGCYAVNWEFTNCENSIKKNINKIIKNCSFINSEDEYFQDGNSGNLLIDGKYSDINGIGGIHIEYYESDGVLYLTLRLDG